MPGTEEVLRSAHAHRMTAETWLGAAARAPVEQAADGLLANLGLLFVPAGVGVVALWGMLERQGGAIGVVLVLSAIVTLALTVWTFLLARRLLGGRNTR